MPYLYAIDNSGSERKNPNSATRGPILFETVLQRDHWSLQSPLSVYFQKTRIEGKIKARDNLGVELE